VGDPLSNPVAERPHATLEPRRLGRYEVISQLAKGGMGQVYLARTRGVGGFERLVVVKCALPSLAEQTQQMLLAEARLAATLQHTNIVQVHDVDTDGGIVFLAMEFLHGQDARDVLRRSPGQRLPLESAVAIALAVCAGLHYAHERRDADGQPLEIVHRDVSPSNVFVTYDGGIKLIDFGIAKATALPSETQLGSVKGKPGYMSPEQCRCEPLDRRSDLFCVGILLYEMTLGRKPFRADNEYQLHKQIIDDDPPRPTEIDPSYPPVLEAIVMRALAKDRRGRQATALALQEELAGFAAAERLDVSQFALGRYMGKLFADELEAWQDAVRSGQSLVEHVIRRTTSTVRVLDVPPVGTEPRVIDRAPPARRRWPVILGLTTLASAAAVAIVMYATSTPDPAAANAAVVPVESPSPPDATASTSPPPIVAPSEPAVAPSTPPVGDTAKHGREVKPHRVQHPAPKKPSPPADTRGPDDIL
jgi:serine/threonine-protein kinase